MDRNRELIRCPECKKIFSLRKEDVTPRISCSKCNFEMDSVKEIKRSGRFRRFFDDIPFTIIQTAEDNEDFQAGRKAAYRDDDRDESKGLDWILGYDSVKEGTVKETV